MRERLDHRRVDRQDWVKEIGETDAVCLGYQAEEVSVAIEAPGSAPLGDLEARLVIAVEERVCDLALGILICELERVGTEPLHVHDSDQTVRQDAADCGVGLEVFESAHTCSVMAPRTA